MSEHLKLCGYKIVYEEGVNSDRFGKKAEFVCLELMEIICFRVLHVSERSQLLLTFTVRLNNYTQNQRSQSYLRS